MKEIIFAGLLVCSVAIVGAAMAHGRVFTGQHFKPHVCSATNAVACILSGRKIPN